MVQTLLRQRRVVINPVKGGYLVAATRMQLSLVVTSRR